jgi:hypothetical protein
MKVKDKFIIMIADIGKTILRSIADMLEDYVNEQKEETTIKDESKDDEDPKPDSYRL